jgi:glutamine cyclotransferase
VEWTATSNQSWFTLSAESGVTGPEPDTLWVEVDRTTLPLSETSYATLRIADAENDVRTILFRANKVAEPARGFVEIARFPHDPHAFTQGLEWLDGALIEGTGLNGESTLRRVDLETGIAQQSVALGPEVFGEGLTVWNDRILQLTWLAQEAYVWDATTFAPLDTLAYPTQGWGLTHDAERLIMSDGTANLYFRDPDTFTELGRVGVTTGRVPLNRLNELEWIDGLVWANVWLTDYIVRIDPATGLVVDWLDLTGLLPSEYAAAADVLNGIAWDAANERLFVTGKDWPLLFEIEPLPFD